MNAEPLKVVTFNFLPFAYETVTKWIHHTGNQHVLAVTTPGPTTRPTPSYRGIIDLAPRDVDVLITTRLRKVATPLIRALEPDLILCMSFPYRLTPELISIPRIGAVNLHPAVLPAYRGPNAMRQFYEGAPEYGVTVHWMAEDFDTGDILSQKSAPMPEWFNVGEVTQNMGSLVDEALVEGLERAIAGDEGIPQDHDQATYAAPFTEEETWLDWSESRQILRRKEGALNMFGFGSAKALIEDVPYKIMSLEVHSDAKSTAQPGQLLSQDDRLMVVQVGDGSVRVEVEPLSE